MLVKVKKHDIDVIQDEMINENEVNISDCIFEFSEDYAAYSNLVKKAVFVDENNNKSYEILINNNQCNYPPEILKNEGFYLLGVYAYEVKDNNLVLRFSPKPCNFKVIEGSYKDNSENSKPITPSEMEQYQQVLQEGLNKLESELENVVKIAEEVGKNSEYAKEQGNYAKEQGNKAEQLLDNIDGKFENNLNQAKDYADNLTIKDIKEVRYDEKTSVFTFVRHDNTELVVDLPIEQLLKNGYYDEESKELVLVLENEQEIRIPASGLIDDYSTEDSDTIQLSLSASNVFKAILKGQSIKKTHLSQEFQKEIDSKLVEADLDGLKQDVDNLLELSDEYVRFNNYASLEKSGVIKIDNDLGVAVDINGVLNATTKSYNEYETSKSETFISKGTLDNVLENSIGVINNMLDTINGEVI